jgi:hypothetical protein
LLPVVTVAPGSSHGSFVGIAAFWSEISSGDVSTGA